jgi:hypothetical protein
VCCSDGYVEGSLPAVLEVPLGSLGGFLDAWRQRAMRSRLEPMKKAARMLGADEELFINWFRA